MTNRTQKTADPLEQGAPSVELAGQYQLVRECMQDLRRIVKALETYAKTAERKFGLTGPQLWALWELSQGGSMPLKDLATRMHLDPSTVTGVLDRLALKGLIVRNPDAQDRRRISLALTDKATSLLASAPHPAQGHLLAGLLTMEQTRVQVLHDSLRTLVGVLEAERLEAPFFFAEA